MSTGMAFPVKLKTLKYLFVVHGATVRCMVDHEKSVIYKRQSRSYSFPNRH